MLKSSPPIGNTAEAPEDIAAIALPDSHAEATAPPAVLITEQEVMFSTAAAAWGSTRRRESAIRTLVTAARRIVLSSPRRSQPNRHHFPARDSIFEESRLQRELHRL
jgi:hypothetical protein